MERLASLARLDRQRGALFPWVPVCLGLGIGGYFALPVEPDARVWSALGVAVCLGLIALAFGAGRWPWITALILIAAGVGVAGLRTAMVEAPVLPFRYYGAVEGRIVKIDRSGSDAVRLTLDRVVLERTSPDRVPARVRLSLHGDQRWLDPHPGQTVLITGHLSAPDGPVEPGGFDFRRMAWFDGIGAVGYTRVPAVLLEPAGQALAISRLRGRIAAAVRAALPGDTGAFAAAITTGDRSGIAAETLADLRVSNLAHLLAISGLHMGLMTGVVFGLLRLLLALPSSIALGWPTKSIAAGGALAAGAFYLALSGGNVATQRAFVMAAVILIAVMLNRRAMTLRAVAVAATLILILRPEAMTEPGFQMSFSATVGLVWVFRMLRDRSLGRGAAKWVATLIISSAVAGAATAPFGAAHFNQLSQYGLIANLLSVPLMGAVVMPGAVLAAVLAPFGLAWIGLGVMAPAIDWILLIARTVAGWNGAAIPVIAPGSTVLPLISLGAIFLILWQGRERWLGILPMILGVVLWSQVTRPEVLVDGQGSLGGVLTSKGRALSKAKGGSFAARVWLENDGDSVDQISAASRWGERMPLGRRDLPEEAHRQPLAVVHIHGRDNTDRAERECRDGVIVVTSADMPKAARDCIMLDRATLRETGAVALASVAGRPVLSTVADFSGERPWTRRSHTRR